MTSTASELRSLSDFHPLVQRWFADRYGRPTDIQAQSWPEIATGHHVLITAPTGSGKTLTAFLWAINQFVTGEYQTGTVKVLYISPLKALNNDIRRNLLGPLSELRRYFQEAGEDFPDIQVLTRSGDTEARDRRRMLSHPPEILITTPESLNIMLTSKKSRELFTDLSTVILDEIHSVAGDKRGTHLITGIDRLVPLAGEFQRIALSATVKPLEKIARFVGGNVMVQHGDHAEYIERPVRMIRSTREKRYDIRVDFPADTDIAEKGSVWKLLVPEFKKIISRNQSTLFFTNSRRLSERISLMLNEDQERPVAYSHHGSLSRQTRLVVEERLKKGELSAIVATSSLELGIDVGALDEVVLVETPGSVSSAVQRIGRAGHNVGETSRGTIFPAYGRDFLDAAVVSSSIIRQDIESINPIRNPLDVLAQVITSMAAAGPWDIDKLYNFIRTSYPFRKLPRRYFDLVLNMLAGRYKETRLRDLKPLVSVDRIDNVVTARDGAAWRVYSSGGTIPDRGYFTLRLDGSNARIGELDEEFVWESSVGDTFTLGTQAWTVKRITHNDVFVVPGRQKASQAPFWRAEEINRDYHLSARIADFLEDAEPLLESGELHQALCREHAMSEAAAEGLVNFLKRQKTLTDKLPHRHRLVIEYVNDPAITGGTRHAIIHTLWGGKLNRPLALAMSALWQKHHGARLEIFTSNDGIAIVMPEGFHAPELLRQVADESLEALLRQELELSGFFGARFRENASRALLLGRKSLKTRTPLWLSRLRSKKLLEIVSQYEDFPIVLETWRTCLQDEFDLEDLRQLLDELAAGRIEIHEAETMIPSPFAADLVWGLTNKYVYLDDAPDFGGPSRLHPDLLKELVFSAELRPDVPPGIAAAFQAKLQRTAPGYAPRSARELLDWIKERLFIPQNEWQPLLEAVQQEISEPAEAILAEIKNKAVGVTGEQLTGVIAAENVPRFLEATGLRKKNLAFCSLETGQQITIRPPRITHEPSEERDPLADWLAEWLRYYGPVSRPFITDSLGIDEIQLEEALESLLDANEVIVDRITTGAEHVQICDSENMETLLRLMRAAARPTFQPLEQKYLPLFIAEHQGLASQGGSVEDLQQSLERLFGYPAPAELWEKEYLPARLQNYSPSWLDSLTQQSDLIWFGCGKAKIAFCFDYDLNLFLQTTEEQEPQPADSIRYLMPEPSLRYNFMQLLQHSNRSSSELTDLLWKWAWQGQVSNDSFATLRNGVQTRFKAPDVGATKASYRHGRPGRRAYGRWKSTRPFTGNWFRLSPERTATDALEEDELNKDRVRILLDRYGILFREILSHELPPLRWGSIFRALRLMELSGEILAGYFFEGIPGLQFISLESWQRLQKPLPEEAIYWTNATDPASLCGQAPSGEKATKQVRDDLPSRLPSTHIVYHGTQIVIISKRNGKELEIRAAADDPTLPAYFSFFHTLLNRQFQPMRSISIETINAEPAQKTRYAQILQQNFNTTVDYRGIRLWKSF